MRGKRKWQEQDWEVAMAAQTFVAVLAASEEEEEETLAMKTKSTKKKKDDEEKKMTSTRRSTRNKKQQQDARAEQETKQEDNDNQDVAMTTTEHKQVDEFWLAQLQDDVTEDMLAHPEDVSVHVTWLNRTADRRYERAYDEQVDVSSILCHVFLKELSVSVLELTTKSLERVQRSLRRTKAKLAGQDVDEQEEDKEEEDDERPPPPLTTSSGRKRRNADEDKTTGARGGKGSSSGKSRKLTKREAAMHIPPLRATVDETKYEDREVLGSQLFETFSGDVASANREVVRAVLTRNVKLLKQLTTKEELYSELSTFDAPRSADIDRTALHYAIDTDDLAAAALLRQTEEKVDKQKLAAAPEVALPSHSTGQHTSRFSDYNRRAINASRGGKEGNNALLGDGYDAHAANMSLDYLWRCSNASVEMLTLLYPTGDWTNGYAVGNNVCRAARCGNFRLVRKVVETLEKNGGWGFNELHHKVLADRPNDDGGDGGAAASLLPPFRAVSAIKQAHQTRLRPLHLAAINPDTRYLDELWAVAGDEFSAIKDDQGYEPIHYAAGCESPAPMQYLLEKRCGMFGRTKTRLTPLMCALEAEREETALALLRFAATPGESGGGGQEVADKLVREKGPGGKQAVHFAARHGCAKVLEYLLTECGGAADINAVSGGTHKSTPLTFAAQNGHLECVHILLASGARVDLGDKLKKTPLILAVKNGHTCVAAALINGGANVNAYDTSENSVAHYAASYGWPSCLQLLCDVGAELWSQNAWGFVPLACALLKQRRACAEMILAQVSGDDQRKFLDFRDRQGRTMLFLQCQHSHSLDQLSYLLDKGLNPNISDSDGEYPLQRLIQRACDEAPRSQDGSTTSNNQELSKFFLDAVGLLLQHGAHPQYELYHGDPKDEEKSATTMLQPLQLAMVGNQTEIVELLLTQQGVQSDAQSSDGSDAWMTAVALGASIGDSFLSKLLKHHSKTVGGPLKLAGRSRPDRENFFHVVANHDASQLAANPELIHECALQCLTTSEMMCAKDVDGYTPVMRLLDPSHERSVPSASDHSDPDKLQHMRDVDARLTELLAIYTEMTTTREAFIRCEEASRLRELTRATCRTENDAFNGAVPASDALANPSNLDDDLDESYEDGSDDDSDGDDSGDNSSDDGSSAIPTRKPRPAAAMNGKDEGKPKIMVEFETALHLIARRKLTSEPTNPWMKWFGCSDHSAKCLMHVLLEKRPELFSASSEDKEKSLVNFVHFGSFKTALHCAVESGDVPTVRVLLSHRADPNLSPVRCTNCKEFAVADAIARAKGDSAISRESRPACTGSCGLKTLLEPPLFEAVQAKHIKCTRILLKHGAEVNCVSKTTQETPLHVALRANDGASVSSLLSHGASLMARDAFGASPLHLAVVARHSIPTKEAHAGEVAYSTVTINRSFPAGRPIPSNTSIFSVTASSEVNKQRGESPDAVEPAILVALKDANAQQAVIVGDTKNRSPVHYAARNRDLELLQALLRAAGRSGARGAVNQRDWLGRTPLHYAVNAAAMSADASFAVERFLLQNGADAGIQDDFGFGALHFALVKVQLDWQEKYDTSHKKTQGQKDREGQVRDAKAFETEKREAFLREQLSVVPGGEADPVETVSNLSAERGLNLTAPDTLGRSPLHLAAATGAFVCVSTLLASIGDSKKQKDAMALQDRDGFTALGLAVLHKRQTTIMTLLRSGSAVDGELRLTQKSSNSRGSTSTVPEPKVKTRSYFYHAVSNGLTGICHMLLSAKFCRRQAIEDSVRCGQFQLANNLLGVLESGSDGGLELLNRPNSRGESLLHSLAKTQQIGFDALAKKLAWALVDAGVPVDLRDNKGNLALHYAAKRGNIHLMDFLLHQSGGKMMNGVANQAGETPLVFALTQTSTGKSLGDEKLLRVLCYLLERPSHPGELRQHTSSGMNVLSGFLDRFTESLAVSEPVVFFSMLETLLKRGVDTNKSFHSAHAATLERKRPNKDEDKDQLLRSGRELYEITAPTEIDNDKMTPLIRVALTPDASIRYHTLALLLRYGAKLSTVDGRGNTLLMHLIARNLIAETRLALGLIRSVPDPKDVFASASSTRTCSLHIPEANVKSVLAQKNSAGKTACHMAVQPLHYGSYENTRLVAMLVRAGGDLNARDASGKSVLDYAREQRSRFVLRFLERTFPKVVAGQTEAPEPRTEFAAAPMYSDDANAYLAECETTGKISRSLVVAKVNASCDVGKVSKVHSEGGDEGTELDALLTKVDVKNGRFGLNVFYRLQLVRDELQDIYVLFTNWGRIGETGKFQNTPFRDEAEAVSEFKKIFRSKTGNTWESRAPGEFVKKPKKYNLVQRVNHSTKVDDEVTRSFRDDMEGGASRGVVFPDPRDPDLARSPSVMAMLAAITDVRNLQLAAQSSCGFAGGDLPLAKQDELRVALEKLREIRSLLEEKEELVKEIGAASGDLSDEGATKRALLATRHEALTEKVSECSSRYYEIMPCQEDALATSIKAFDQVGDVNVEITRLRLLSDIMETYKMLLGAKRAQATQNPLEYCYHALQVRLAPLQPVDPERQLIHRYFFGGLRSYDRQRYRISNVFEVERCGETQRFNDLMEDRPDLRAMQTHLLWHGTKRTNLMGILSQGLRVAPPEAPHHGYAYGKGLYFANVAEKSLNYCDAAYALPILDKSGKPDRSTTKTREVHYMLLCEVSLGNPTELTAIAAWGTDPLPREGMDSVKALAMHNPDPRGTIVSPKCGAKLHMGKVKQVGRGLPYDRVWAKTDPNPTPMGWYERNPKFTPDTQDYLAKLVADKSFAVGDTHTVSTTNNEREHFVQYQYDQRAVVIELVSRETSDSMDDEEDAVDAAPEQAGSGAWCEATLKVTIRPDDGTPYSYIAKLYRNALTSSPLSDGFKLVEPALSDYAELVVYKEAQARIRYVVEVETV